MCDCADGNDFALVIYKSSYGTAHQYTTGSMAVGLIGFCHLFQILNEIQLSCPLGILETEFTVLNADRGLGLDGIGLAELLLVPQLVGPNSPKIDFRM